MMKRSTKRCLTWIFPKLTLSRVAAESASQVVSTPSLVCLHGGRPLEEFLFDPPLPIPEGLDLINKPQLWQRMLPSGEPALDEEELPIFDLLIWVGAEHYKYCPDYLEEVKMYGASRRLNPNLDLSLLSRSSRMILAHPHVLNMRWHEQRPPLDCKKAVPGHDAALAASDDEVEGATSEAEEEMSLSAFVHRAGDNAGGAPSSIATGVPANRAVPLQIVGTDPSRGSADGDRGLRR